MNWEDTVMSNRTIEVLLQDSFGFHTDMAVVVARAQAKVSFKAGYQQALKDYNIDTTTSGVGRNRRNSGG